MTGPRSETYTYLDPAPMAYFLKSASVKGFGEKSYWMSTRLKCGRNPLLILGQIVSEQEREGGRGTDRLSGEVSSRWEAPDLFSFYLGSGSSLTMERLQAVSADVLA